jgi:hypothetical protein
MMQAGAQDIDPNLERDYHNPASDIPPSAQE